MEAPGETRVTVLDGWRGIAILLVLADHAQGSFLHRYYGAITATGQHGVTIFFVLSGFLITSKLLEGNVSLKQFYVRRVFRIMPLAWLYLSLMWLIGLSFHGTLFAPGEFEACLFSYKNFFSAHQSELLGHFWSLSIEEQFYLVWPSVVLLAGSRAARRFAIGGIFLCVLIRSLFASYYDRPWFSLRTEVRADALLVGCLLALMFEQPEFRAWFARYARAMLYPALAVLLVCMSLYSRIPPLAECVAIALLIGSTTVCPRSWMARALSFRSLVSLGIVSYGVYVWQQVVFCVASTTFKILLLAMMPAFILGLHNFIERPMISVGRRLTTEEKPALAEA